MSCKSNPQDQSVQEELWEGSDDAQFLLSAEGQHIDVMQTLIILSYIQRNGAFLRYSMSKFKMCQQYADDGNDETEKMS